MNRELFILTIIMLGWKKVDNLTYNKAHMFALIDNPYLQIQTGGRFYTFVKYKEMLNWINKHSNNC